MFALYWTGLKTCWWVALVWVLHLNLTFILQLNDGREVGLAGRLLLGYWHPSVHHLVCMSIDYKSILSTITVDTFSESNWLLDRVISLVSTRIFGFDILLCHSISVLTTFDCDVLDLTDSSLIMFDTYFFHTLPCRFSIHFLRNNYSTFLSSICL